MKLWIYLFVVLLLMLTGVTSQAQEKETPLSASVSAPSVL